MPEFARRIKTMERSANIMRGVFSGMTDPNLISFGGGNPAREALPIETLQEIANEVFTRDGLGELALAYGSPQGYLPLRSAVCTHLLEPKGIACSPEQLLITTGGLQTMNLICQIYINPGDVILVETPTFMHCVEVFEMFEAKCVSVVCDDYGMVMEDLEAKIKQYHPKMIYVVPTFQNPTGKTMPVDRRKRLAELGSEYDVIVIEDDPYRDIRYSGEELPPIKTFDQSGHTVLAGSFSKIFSPGARLGYVLATPEIIHFFYQMQTATVAHTSMVTQVLCAEFFERGHYPEHLQKTCAIHKERRDTMMDCIDEYFPVETKHTYPDGGLFTWVELPDDINATELLPEAQERLVTYVAGESFFTDPGMGANTMRLCFSAVPSEKIDTGMRRLGELIQSKV